MSSQSSIAPSAEFIEVKTAIKVLLSEVKDLKTTVNTLKATVSNVETKISNVAVKMSNIETKVENDLKSMENTVGRMENTVNRKIGNLWWQVGLGLIAGFYLIFHVFDDKLDFMNEQYSDRFSRMEAGISVSSPDVLVLIDKIKKDYEDKLASQKVKAKSEPLKPKKKK